MKALKSLFLFIFSVVLTSCFDSPEFGEVPKIEFRSIYFGYAPTPSQLDSLVVELSFRDGDGDLGLGDEYRNYPYHEYDLFLTDGTAVTATVRNAYPTPTSRTAFLDIPDGVTGKILRFGDLPGMPADNCQNYKQLDVLVEEADKHVFDETYTVVPQQNYYVVSGKFRSDVNKYSKNIFVRFYRNPTPDNPNGFVEFKWPQCQTFDGAFVNLSEESSPLSGTMRYTMSSFGFATTMNIPGETWKMSFTVVDRSRRGDSDDTGGDNTVTTPPFTLDEITR